MEVIEQFSQSKTGHEENMEDLICVTDTHAAVIDGATSKTDFRVEGKTSGWVASQLVRKAIEELPPEINMPDAVRSITEKIHRLYRSKGWERLMEENPMFRAIATTTIYSRFHHELWFIGDCRAHYQGETITSKRRVDQTLAQTRALTLEIELLKGESVESLQATDPGREFILPLLRQQSRVQNHPNNPFSYLCFDGFEVPPDQVRVHELPEGLGELVLGTDGYPRLFATLGETEDYLQEKLQEDPLCIGPLMSTKCPGPGDASFDDRAYLRLRL